MPTQVTDWTSLNNACSNPATYAPDGIIQVMNNIAYGTNNSVIVDNTKGININIQSSGGPWTLQGQTNAGGGNNNRHFLVGYNGQNGFIGTPNATFTIDNIILDGGTGASANTGVAPTPGTGTTFGGGIIIASGTNTIGPNCTIQNCWTGWWNVDGGGYGALCVHSWFGSQTQIPTVVNFSGIIQYNTNGSNQQQYQEAPGGVMVFQRNGWNTNNQPSGPATIFNMTGGSISYNSSFCGGGGMCLDTYAQHNTQSNCTFNMSAGTISYNVAATVGGGIMCGSQSDDLINMNLSGGSISYNKATGTGTYYMTANGIPENGNGGGIWLMDGTTTISGSIQIWYNTASNFGGGAYTSAAVASTDPQAPNIVVNGGDWKANTAIQGAAIYKSGGPLTVSTGNFHQHTSTGDGAVFYAQASSISLNATALPTNLTPSETNNTVVAGTISVFDNKAGGNGGVVNVSGTRGTSQVNSSFTATNVLFYNNSAAGNGGVLYSSSGSSYSGSGTPPTVTNNFTNCILSKNSATNGGAYWVGM